MVDILFAAQQLPNISVSHEDLWKIMAKFGGPEEFINIKCQFHDDMLAWVLDKGQFSHTFPVISE